MGSKTEDQRTSITHARACCSDGVPDFCEVVYSLCVRCQLQHICSLHEPPTSSVNVCLAASQCLQLYALDMYQSLFPNLQINSVDCCTFSLGVSENRGLAGAFDIHNTTSHIYWRALQIFTLRVSISRALHGHSVYPRVASLRISRVHDFLLTKRSAFTLALEPYACRTTK